MNGQVDNNNDDDVDIIDTDWKPPTEAELKVLEARRERNNKISSLMGQYLLKGYKMLATTCAHCDCILLEDRQKRKYCIGCNEVDTDAKKDNPAVNEHAARTTVAESQHRRPRDSEMEGDEKVPFETVMLLPKQKIPKMERTSPVIRQLSNTLQPSSSAVSERATQTFRSTHQSVCNPTTETDEEIDYTLRVLKRRLSWTADWLRNNTNIQECINLVRLINETANAIKSVQELKKS